MADYRHDTGERSEAKDDIGYILDLDGTVLDSAAAIEQALRMIADKYGIDASLVARGLKRISAGTRAMLGEMYGGEEKVAMEICHEAEDFYYKQIGSNEDLHKLFPGVKEFLTELRKNKVPCAIVTNKPPAMVGKILRHLGLDVYFSDGCVICADEKNGIKKKPDPMMMQLACKNMGVLPRHVVSVGDGENDAIASNAADIRVFVGAMHGYVPADPESLLKVCKVSYSIASFGRLRELHDTFKKEICCITGDSLRRRAKESSDAEMKTMEEKKGGSSPQPSPRRHFDV